MGIELRPGETTLGSWTMVYEGAGRRPITGNLVVTSGRIVFDPKMEVSTRSMRQVRQSLSGDWKSHNTISIEAGDVADIRAEKGFFKKKVIVSTSNGGSYEFNRGMMSVDPIMAALGRA